MEDKFEDIIVNNIVDLVSKRDELVGQCKAFQTFIESNWEDHDDTNSNSYELKALLECKKALYNSANDDNFDETLSSLEKIDTKICNRIRIIKREFYKDLKRPKNLLRYTMVKDNLRPDPVKDILIQDFLLDNQFFKQYLNKESSKIKKEINKFARRIAKFEGKIRCFADGLREVEKRYRKFIEECEYARMIGMRNSIKNTDKENTIKSDTHGLV